MLYNSVRWLIFFCIIGLIALLLNKTPVKKYRKIYFAIIIVSSVVCFSQWNIPFENYIVSFPTLEKSFKYCLTENNIEIFGIFEEEKTGLVLYESENGYANYITRKDEDGWKISNINTNEIECVKTVDKHTIFVYHIKNTSERYVLISSDFTDKVAEITDSKGNVFRYVEDKDDFSKHITYFNHYGDNNFDFTVFIDGKKIDLEKT